MCVIVDTSCLAISKVMSKKSDSLVQWFIFYVKFFIFRVQFLLTSAKGSYALRIGAKHAFAGADPKLSFGYVGDETNRYEVRNRMDKTRMVVSVGGETEFAPGWTLSGDAAFEKGAHDRDLMLTVLLRRMW